MHRVPCSDSAPLIMALFVALLVGGAVTPAEAQVDTSSVALTTAQVDQAIAQGLHDKHPMGVFLDLASTGFAGGLIRSSAERTGGRYFVQLQGPYARVVTAAAEHAKAYLTYTPDSVGRALTMPYLSIRAMPQAPVFAADHQWRSTPDVTRIVLLPTGKGAAPIQPVSVEPLAESHTYGSGMTAETHGVIALFRLEQIPASDFDVVLVTTGAEKRERVRGSDVKYLH